MCTKTDRKCKMQIATNEILENMQEEIRINRKQIWRKKKLKIKKNTLQGNI